MIRISRITFAFRNRVWPKPMEGLELFNPVPAIIEEESSSTSPSPTPEDSEEEESVYSEGSEEEEERSIDGREDGQSSKFKMTIGKRKADGPLMITLHPNDGNFQVQKVKELIRMLFTLIHYIAIVYYGK